MGSRESHTAVVAQFCAKTTSIYYVIGQSGVIYRDYCLILVGKILRYSKTLRCGTDKGQNCADLRVEIWLAHVKMEFAIQDRGGILKSKCIVTARTRDPETGEIPVQFMRFRRVGWVRSGDKVRGAYALA